MQQGWQSFVSDPEVPPIMKTAGHKAARSRPSSSVAATPDPPSCRGGATRCGVAPAACYGHAPMIDFSLTDEQTTIVETVRDFVRRS